MSIRTKIITGVIGLSALVPAKAQKAAEVIPKTPIVETLAKDTVAVKNKLTTDVSLRTLQFFDGTNLTALGAGLKKSYTNSSLSSALLAGYDFGNKRPWGCGYVSYDHKYGDTKNRRFWLSQVLYGQVSYRNGAFGSKFAYTPVKLNAKLSNRVNLTFDPRFAVQINQNGVAHKIETLTRISSSITKNFRPTHCFKPMIQ